MSKSTDESFYNGLQEGCRYRTVSFSVYWQVPHGYDTFCLTKTQKASNYHRMVCVLRILRIGAGSRILSSKFHSSSILLLYNFFIDDHLLFLAF